MDIDDFDARFDQFALRMIDEYNLNPAASACAKKNRFELTARGVKVNDFWVDSIPVTSYCRSMLYEECMKDKIKMQGLANWFTVLMNDAILRPIDVPAPLLEYELWNTSKTDLKAFRDQFGDYLHVVEPPQSRVVGDQFPSQEAHEIHCDSPASQTDVLVGTFLSGASTMHQIVSNGLNATRMTPTQYLQTRDIVTAMSVPCLTPEVKMTVDDKCATYDYVDRLAVTSTVGRSLLDQLGAGPECTVLDPEGSEMRYSTEQEVPDAQVADSDVQLCSDEESIEAVSLGSLANNRERVDDNMSFGCGVHRLPRPKGKMRVSRMSMIPIIHPCKLMGFPSELRIVRYILFPLSERDGELVFSKPHVFEMNSLPMSPPNYPYGPWPLYTYPSSYHTGYSQQRVLVVVGVFIGIPDVVHDPRVFGEEGMLVKMILKAMYQCSVKKKNQMLDYEMPIEIVAKQVRVGIWDLSLVCKRWRNAIGQVLERKPAPRRRENLRVWNMPFRDMYHRVARQAIFRHGFMVDYRLLVESGVLSEADLSMLDIGPQRYIQTSPSVRLSSFTTMRPDTASVHNIYSAARDEMMCHPDNKSRYKSYTRAPVRFVSWMEGRSDAVGYVNKLQTEAWRDSQYRAAHYRDESRLARGLNYEVGPATGLIDIIDDDDATWFGNHLDWEMIEDVDERGRNGRPDID